MKCPVCERPNPVHAPYCESCGADLKDPDVLAMAGAGPTVTAPGAEASLASDKFLGVSAAGLADGRDLRKLAWIGGAAMLLSFLIPIDPDGSGGGLRMPWSLLGEGRTVPIIVPVLVAAIGIELAVLGARIPHAVRAGFLFAAGAATIVLAMGRGVAEGAGVASSPPWLVWGGAIVAAIGVAARVLRPLDRNARWVIAGGLGLVAIGFVIPAGSPQTAWPFEYWYYIGGHLDSTIFEVSRYALGRGFYVALPSLWLLALPVAIGGALALAFRRPSGPWDTQAAGLRPIGWIVCLYLPLTFLLLAVNMAGWEPVPGFTNDLVNAASRALFAGRARLVLVTLGAAAWVVGGGAALYLTYAPAPSAPATDAPTRTA